MKKDNGVKVLFRGALYVYDDLKEKTKKYEEENLWTFGVRYACKHGGRKFKSESTGVMSSS